LDVIDKVGHMGNFLAQRHTMDYLRKGEIRLSSLWDKRVSEKASRDGFKTMLETARDRMDEILRDHSPMPLDGDVERDLGRILKEAQRTLVR
jgi:trimethylamine:corrinoid methyltransferase-like protein